KHLAGELEFAAAQRPAAAGFTQPGQVETGELEHGVKAEATGHHRIAKEVAFEKPHGRVYVELGNDHTLAVGTALARDVGDAIHHQHRRGRQEGLAFAEHFTAPTVQQVITVDVSRTRPGTTGALR